MALTDLVFSSPPLTGLPVALVFGDTGDVVVPPAIADIAGVFPAPAFTARLRDRRTLALTGTFPAMVFMADARYASKTARPTVGQTAQPWQVATHGEVGVDAAMQRSTATPVGAATSWTPANRAAGASTVRYTEAQRYTAFRTSLFEGAARLATQATAGRYQDADRAMRIVCGSRYQEGTPAHPEQTRARYQDGLRDRRLTLAEYWQTALRLAAVGNTSSASAAVWLNLGWLAAYQEAMRPPAGTSPIDVVPPFEPCYLPSTHLLFAAPWSADPNLVFICERHGPGPQPGTTVVVPIKRIYMTVNTIALRRVDGDISIPAYGFAMSIDVDSYTWSLSASLPGMALADLQPAFPGDPVLLEAWINGVAYRFLVNSISRERQFAQSGIRVSARGLLSTLDSPFVPSMYFGNDEDPRTAQQLMGDVLTLNGIPLDWTVDWGLTDWNVPANVWSHTGSYISALNNIAQAAGGYIQPHPSLKTLYVKPRYPDGPWNWASLTPDFEIPAAVATTESIEWLDKAVYNRVYVSGETGGVLGVITRDGTAGDLVAQMVTDPLITEGLAARQRGLSILSDTGLQANVTLRLPVLTETGIIVPGHLIDYVDGGTTRRGIVRSTQVSVGGEAKVWQSIGIETHVS